MSNVESEKGTHQLASEAGEQVDYLPAVAPDKPASSAGDSLGESDAKDVKIDSEKASLEATSNEKIGSQDDILLVKGEPVIRNGLDVSRFVVSLRDDGDKALTFRSIVLGSALTALSSVITVLYLFKPVTVSVSSVFLVLICYVLGQAWARLTPKPSSFEGVRGLSWLVPVLTFMDFGRPFGLKEHVVASLIASCGNNSLSGVEVLLTEKLFYNKSADPLTAVLGLFSISLCGFVIAGVLRPIIVYPAEMVFYSSLPLVSLFQSLHHDTANNKDRLRSFGKTLTGSAIWQLFPAYIFQTLNGISVVCFATVGASLSARKKLTHIFGGANSNEGVALLNFSLDWQYITSSATALPLKQQANSWVGLLAMYPLFLGLYYANAWGSKQIGLPMLSTSLFNEDGSRYNLTAVFGSSIEVNRTALAEQGLPRLTSSTLWGYTSANLALGALISHTLVFYRKDIWTAYKQGRARTQPDPHYVAMLKYKECPMWWYYACFVLAFFAGLGCVIHGQTTLPVWAYIVALIFGGIIAPFSAFIYAYMGNGIATNALSKMLGGVLVPGRPLANLYFASWSHQVILLAINLAGWLKMGQYMKIPPRVMFATQAYGTLLGCAINYAVGITVVKARREILLDPIGSNIWSGSALQTLNSQAVTWSLAKEIYSLNGPYKSVPLGFFIGAAVPLVHYGLTRIFKRLRKIEINTPLILQYTGGYNYSGSFSYLSSTIVVGIISQLWLRRRHPGWYNKYNYLLGAGLDGGSQICMFVLSFAVNGASGVERPFPTWWGNPSGNVDHCNPK